MMVACFSLFSTPAKAGAQLGKLALVIAALVNEPLRCWAPAFAGVVFKKK
jgi:hypothetical protein